MSELKSISLDRPADFPSDKFVLRRSFWGAFQTGVPRAQLQRLASQTPVNAAVTFTIVAVTTIVLLPVAPIEWLVPWAAAQISLLALVLMRWWKSPARLTGEPAIDLSLSRRGLRHAVTWAALSGGLWGGLTVFLPVVPTVQQVALILVMGGMAAGAGITLAAVLQVSVSFILASTIPLSTYYFIAGGPDFLALGIMFTTFTVGMIFATRVVHKSLFGQLEAEAARAHTVADMAILLSRFDQSRNEWLTSAAAAEPFALFDTDGALLLWNEALTGVLGSPADVLIRNTAREEFIKDICLPEGVSHNSGEAVQWRRSLLELHHAPGRTLTVQMTGGHWFNISATLTSTGQIVMIFADVTAQMEVEKSLRYSEVRLKSAQRVARVGSWIRDLESNDLTWSDELYSILGHEPGSIRPDRAYFENQIHKEDLARFRAVVTRGLQDEIFDEIEFRLLNTKGEIRNIRARGEIILNDEDHPSLAIGTFQDITDLRRAEAALLQSQKMEAVGQLTGGIAHDFNNLLLVVHGNLELAAEKLEAAEPNLERILHLIGRAREGAARGSELNKRLLAFARRQDLKPVNLDVNQLIGGMEELIGRAVGEAIEISYHLSPQSLFATVDPSQLESALLNLVINSRDAMPGGGRLEISTSLMTSASGSENNPSGSDVEMVAIGISDNGHGIEDDLLGKVLEPFFTTKDVDKGSGLGLSMVYGFARQSGGEVGIESVPGEGTTVSIRLPRSDAEPISRQGDSGTVDDLQRGEEKILVIEDKEELRDVVSDLLQGLGYEVVVVKDGPSALEMIEEGLEFDLAFTDIVLPKGLNGFELAEKIVAMRPGTKILYTSGYAADAITDMQQIENVPLLKKPYKRTALAAAVRAALEG